MFHSAVWRRERPWAANSGQLADRPSCLEHFHRMYMLQARMLADGLDPLKISLQCSADFRGLTALGQILPVHHAVQFSGADRKTYLNLY